MKGLESQIAEGVSDGRTMRKYWDERAIQEISYLPAYVHAKTLRRDMSKLIYIELTKRVLIHSKKTDEVLFLKTDLWNEGVDRSRGDLCEFLKDKKGVDAFGIDVSPIVCSLAKQQVGEKVWIICSDVRTLPFKNSSIDIIFDLSTVDHVSEKYTNSTISEYARILKNDGVLLLIFRTNSSIWRLRYDAIRSIVGHIVLTCREKKQVRISGTIVRDYCLNPIKVREFLQSCSLRVLEEHCIGTISWIFPPEWLLDRILKRFRIFECARLLEVNLALSSLSKYFMPFAWLYVIFAKKTKQNVL